MKAFFLIIVPIFFVHIARAETTTEKKTDTVLSASSPQEDLLSDICDATEKIYLGKKEINFEKKIAKQSGASNLTNLNDAGRKVVRNTEEVKKLSNRIRKLMEKILMSADVHL